MSAQSRIGFVVLILLVGCILAIPHFRHPTGVIADKDNVENAGEASTLKLRATPDEVAKENESDGTVAKVTKSPPARLRETVAVDRPSVVVQSNVSRPPASLKREEWKFPPVAQPVQQPTPGVVDGYASHGYAAPVEVANARPTPVPIPSDAFDVGRASPTERFPSQPRDFLALAPQRALESPRNYQRHTTTTQFAAKEPAPAAFDDSQTLHRVVNGDTLENLAQQYYGDPRKAMLIFESNRRKLFNPAILPLGLELSIPSSSQ